MNEEQKLKSHARTAVGTVRWRKHLSHLKAFSTAMPISSSYNAGNHIHITLETTNVYLKPLLPPSRSLCLFKIIKYLLLHLLKRSSFPLKQNTVSKNCKLRYK